MRVALDLPAMAASATRLGVVAEDLERTGAALRSGELPPMPAAMASRYASAINVIAARAIDLGEPIAAVGAELRRRALAARVADSEDDARAGARRVADAVDPVAVGGTAAPTPSSHPSAAGADAAAGATTVPAAGHEAVRGAAANAVHAAVAGDAATGAHGELRASAHDGHGGLQAAAMPGHAATEQQWACWMASHAAHDGLPPALPIALALANSGLRNLEPHGVGVGFFGIAPDREIAPAGYGLGATAAPDAAWWSSNPDAQLAHVLARLSAVAPPDLPTSADGLGGWAAAAQDHTDPSTVAQTLATARTLVARCRHGADGAHPDPAHAAAGHGVLHIAESQLGVHESAGDNRGASVDRYLASAGVAPGNPWCASFVSWVMRQSGHPVAGSGWAGVAHWVGAAQQHADGLQMVDAAHARPGDLVAYDWGGGSDFSGDGHIGILASAVGADQHFDAIEGNAGDAVARMHRHLGEGNIVFIRTGAGA
jgi:hypothetical protein